VKPDQLPSETSSQAAAKPLWLIPTIAGILLAAGVCFYLWQRKQFSLNQTATATPTNAPPPPQIDFKTTSGIAKQKIQLDSPLCMNLGLTLKTSLNPDRQAFKVPSVLVDRTKSEKAG
jgi:hypothetical protein